jgi:hypothetical protein
MMKLSLRCLGLNICAALFVLADCGGSQSPISALAVSPQSHTVEKHGDPKGSWMLPEAKSKDLLYVSDADRGVVFVFAYLARAGRIGKLVGKLTGFYQPSGECVDQEGNVFVTDQGGAIVEYAHGSTNPIERLTEYTAVPVACSTDPTTGNLAVANYYTLGRGVEFPGDIAIYANAQGNPTTYSAPAINNFFSCGYDSGGNLFVDGSGGTYSFTLDELLSGGTSFATVSLNENIRFPGTVQWDGKHLAIADPNKGVIYRYAVHGAAGKKVGATPVTWSNGVVQFWIQGESVIGANASLVDVMLWRYPRGGDLVETKKVGQFDEPYGATVSLAPK